MKAGRGMEEARKDEGKSSWIWSASRKKAKKSLLGKSW